MSCDEAEILIKSGKELFRELLRAYPEAEYEDYFKNGQWKDDQMRIDVQLYLAHRSEAGAPEPLDLDDVKLPDLPSGTTGLAGLATFVKPVIGGMGGVLTGLKPAMATPVSGAASELREMAMFVSKYKLDPSKAKTMLMALSSSRRKYVITNFKSESTGGDSLAELEKYIKECEDTKAWGDEPEPEKPATPVLTPVATNGVKPGIAVRPVIPGVVKPAAGAPTIPVTSQGVKRPIISPQTTDANKNPRLSFGTIAAPKVGTIAAPKAGGVSVRPAGVGIVRPAVAVRPAVGVGVVRPAGIGIVRPPQQQQWGQKW
jgi:hypothetical protein